MRLAQAAAHDGEVLRINIHQPAVDRAPAGHDAVAERLVLFQPELVVVMMHKGVNLAEAAGIKQHVQAFARGLLALIVLPLDPRLAAAQLAPGALGAQLLDLGADAHIRVSVCCVCGIGLAVFSVNCNTVCERWVSYTSAKQPSSIGGSVVEI